jgi:ABC-type transport system involved in multi-copper enzyme maturation permease subunit
VSVHKRTYRPFTGTPTSAVARFFVLMRYSFTDVWSSRITNVLFVLCMIPTLISLAMIYIMNSSALRLLLAGAGSNVNISINEKYFFGFLQVQCWMSLVFTAWVGPKLIALDLSNNALPTILSHPISRLEYVLAKFSVLSCFLSVVTWVPLLLLFVLQSYLSETPWAWSHIHIVWGVFFGAAIWIILLTFLALTVSSWVKWRIVATGLVFAATFVPAGMGSVFNQIMRTNWGNLINIPVLMFTLWRRLLHVDLPVYMTRNELPTMAALLALAGMCAGCALALNTRIRAREVVRG